MATTGNDGAASLHCLAIRVAQLAADGTTPAANLMYVTNSLIKIDFNPEVDGGAETIIRGANGNICVNYKLPDIVKRLGISIQLCSPDPELEAILSGGTVLVSGGANGVVSGFQYPQLNLDPVPNGISVEAWTHALVNGRVDPTRPYMRWVFPHIFNLHETNRTIDVNPLMNAFDGKADENASWGNGPANDWPWDSSRVAQWARATSFPVAQLGAQTVPAQV